MPRHYLQLSMEERRNIAKWREAKMPVPEMLSDCPEHLPRSIEN